MMIRFCIIIHLYFLALCRHLYDKQLIARPFGVHYNHCVSPVVLYQVVKKIINLTTHGIF